MSFLNSYRRSFVSSGLALALLLSGCAAEDAALLEDANRFPANASDAYPISVVKGPQTMEVDTGAGTLSAEQVNAVTGFVHQAKLAGVTPITVARPSGGGNSARVASEIASLMMQQGIDRKQVSFRTYAGKTGAPVRISFVSTYAATKPCGDWNQDLTETENNSAYANHGCAVHANLAAMIANPKTAVAPSAVELATAGRAVAAVKKVDKGTGGGSFWDMFF